MLKNLLTLVVILAALLVLAYIVGYSPRGLGIFGIKPWGLR